jgi:hypothetical protein
VTVNERERLKLYERLEQTLGQEHAEVLMEYLPPVGWNDVARRHDVELLRVDLLAEMHQQFSRQLVWLISTLLGCVGAVLGMIAYVS